MNAERETLACTIEQYPNYCVDECGEVISHLSMLPIAQTKSNGYSRVALYNEGKRKNLRVHRLVAMAFIPNPDSLPDVDHIDENKDNNHVSNLQWISKASNTVRSIHLHPDRMQSNKCVRVGLDHYEFHSRSAAAKWLAAKYGKNDNQIRRELTRPDRKTIYGHKIVRLQNAI